MTPGWRHWNDNLFGHRDDNPELDTWARRMQIMQELDVSRSESGWSWGRLVQQQEAIRELRARGGDRAYDLVGETHVDDWKPDPIWAPYSEGAFRSAQMNQGVRHRGGSDE